MSGFRLVHKIAAITNLLRVRNIMIISFLRVLSVVAIPMSTPVAPTLADADTLPVPQTNVDAPQQANTGTDKQKKRLTDFEKGEIMFAYKQGWGYQRIADHIGRSKSTVSSFIKRYNQRGTHENGRHTGRPKKISRDAEKIVLDLVEGNCSIAKVALMQIPELKNIHPRTLDRMLRGKGIRKCVARK